MSEDFGSAPSAGGAAGGKAPIIIKRVKKGGHGHHGGAWKVAYADFVTAMMAFFLLLWLLNAVTEDQLEGVSTYFTPIPSVVSNSTSGAGGLLGGQTIGRGAMQSETGSPAINALPPPSIGDGGEDISDSARRAELTEDEFEYLQAEEEQREFEETAEDIRREIQRVPELASLQESLVIDNTPEGLRIQIVDQEGIPLFSSGSAVMYEYTAQLLRAVARAVRRLPNQIAVEGHTDSIPFSDPSGYSNWELSADRALASRRVLETAGLEGRISRVAGKAATEPLLEDDPENQRNRRLALILLRGSELTTEQLREIPSILDVAPLGRR